MKKQNKTYLLYVNIKIITLGLKRLFALDIASNNPASPAPGICQWTWWDGEQRKILGTVSSGSPSSFSISTLTKWYLIDDSFAWKIFWARTKHYKKDTQKMYTKVYKNQKYQKYFVTVPYNCTKQKRGKK